MIKSIDSLLDQQRDSEISLFKLHTVSKKTVDMIDFISLFDLYLDSYNTNQNNKNTVREGSISLFWRYVYHSTVCKIHKNMGKWRSSTHVNSFFAWCIKISNLSITQQKLPQLFCKNSQGCTFILYTIIEIFMKISEEFVV